MVVDNELEESPEGSGCSTSIDSHPEKKRKRDRSSRACLVCRQRKVKCDAITKYPDKCTNCVQFNIKNCIIPEPKKRQSKKLQQFLQQNDLYGNSTEHPYDIYSNTSSISNSNLLIFDKKDELSLNKKKKCSKNKISSDCSSFDELPNYVIPDSQQKFPGLNVIKLDPSKVLKQKLDLLLKPEYSGWTWPLHVNDQILKNYIDAQVKTFRGPINLEVADFKYLKSIGCFSLPCEELCWKYIDSYFATFNHQYPVINKKQFFEAYKDLKNPPSLILLQSVLYAGCRSYEDLNWSKEKKEQQVEMSNIFHRRAEALYDMKTEPDPVSLLQSILIFGNYWGPNLLVIKTTAFSSMKTAVGVANSIGIHKNLDKYQEISESDKKLYKRIWWSIYIKDCFFSFYVGRPWAIDSSVCDVPMLTNKDFEEDLEISNEETPLQHIYFMHRVKLAQVLKKVCRNFVAVRILYGKNLSPIRLLEECVQLMSEWIEQLPDSLLFRINSDTNNFFSATLSIEYYNILLLIHRCYIVRNPKASNPKEKTRKMKYYPSWGITFKAAHMIVLIGKYMLENNFLSMYQSSMVYTMTAAGTIMIYHLHNKDKNVFTLADKDVKICLDVLTHVTIKWPAANLAYFNLKSIYEDKSKQQFMIKVMLNSLNRNDILDLEKSKTDIIENKKTGIMESYEGRNMPVSGTLRVSAQRDSQIPDKQLQTDHGDSHKNDKITKLTKVSVNSILFNNSVQIPELLGHQPDPVPRKDASEQPGIAINSYSSKNSLGVTHNHSDNGNYSMALNPYPMGDIYNQRLGQLAEAASAIDQGPKNTAFSVQICNNDMQENASVSPLNSNTVTDDTVMRKFDYVLPKGYFPDEISDNWLPSFDIPEFPDDTLTDNNPSVNFDEMFFNLFGKFQGGDI